jgi:hypothetical protein
MTEPFTLKLFVPDGDPEGVRIISHMNWTGSGIAFPRDQWQSVRTRPELLGTGVYILVGHMSDDDDLPTIYVGQGDGVKGRIDAHYQNKDFWDWGIAFVATGSDTLNRAHITWLEYALINRAETANRCHLDNGNTPQEPNLSESEKADTRKFLREVLQILPLVGLRVFEKPKAILGSGAPTTAIDVPVEQNDDNDTIIVPAKREGFEKVFLGEDCWYAIRISGGMLPRIKYIAAYQSQPISAITHLAPVSHIEPYGDGSKYRVVFSEPAKKIEPIPYGDAKSGAMQGSRYTSIEKLRAAATLSDLLN